MATPNFQTSTAVTQTGSHTYTACFQPSWCIGSVPHGGYVTSTLQRAVALHFSTTLSRQNQPHCMTLHLSFLRRTEVGAALFTVTDVKLGARTSTVHVALTQSIDGAIRTEVVGYVTHSHLAREEGVSADTRWGLHPAPPAADVPRLARGTDERWKEQEAMPFQEFRKASRNVRFFFPRQGQAVSHCADEWLALKTTGDDGRPERFTNDSLGFVADMFPQLLELPAYAWGSKGLQAGETAATEEQQGRKASAKFWFPTLLLNLDVKKLLPEEGLEFLFVRVRAKGLKNGRYDLEVVVLDDGGDVVALSHHVCLAVSAERNLAARKRGEQKPERGKL